MFRRKPKVKTAETFFPADLEKLGLFLNEKGELRQLAHPDEGFNYFAFGKSGKLDQSHPSQRLNERRREAVEECLRVEALRRLLDLGLTVHTLPAGASAEDKHVEILASSNISSARRILLIVPDIKETALGILSLREVTDVSLPAGSCETLVRRALADHYDGIIIANPGCLQWDPLSARALSASSFKARDKYAVARHTNPAVIDESAHLIPGHESPESHLASVLAYTRSTLLNRTATPPPQLDFAAAGYAAYATLKALSESYGGWRPYLRAGVVCESPHCISDFPPELEAADGAGAAADSRRPPSFRAFLRERCRAYVLDSAAPGVELPAEAHYGTARFSAGAEGWPAAMIARGIDEILGYFGRCPGGDAGREWDGVNPDVPVVVGDRVVNARAYQEWMDKLKKLDLGSLEGGWEVPGSEEVNELARAAGILDAPAGWGEVFKKDNEWRMPVGADGAGTAVGGSGGEKTQQAAVKAAVRPEEVKLPESPAVNGADDKPAVAEIEKKMEDVKLSGPSVGSGTSPGTPAEK